jgi:uncharacterized repeat protein (TIGR04076 family)
MCFVNISIEVKPMFIVEVSEIRGKCPVYKVGDKIVIDGPEIVLEETDAICIHALAPLLHYVVALREGADPRKLGLSKEKNVAYIQCVDPGVPYTEGGTAIFKCYRVDKEKET